MQVEPSNAWDKAVEPRALFVQGSEKPWQITVATLKSAAGMDALFGEDRSRTHLMNVQVRCLVDAKKQEYAFRPTEVEVGAAGSYDCFKMLGQRGKRVIQQGDKDTGRILVVTLDRNPKSWDYHHPEWQCAEVTCAIAHVSRALTSHLEPTSLKTPITVTQFAVEPIVPIMATVDVAQSAN